MIEDLLKCLHSYVVSMASKGIYFCVEGRNCRKHGEEIFEPAETHILDNDEMTTQELKEEKHKIKAKIIFTM